MPQKSRNRKLARVLCAAFGLAIASSTAAFAGDDSDSNDSWGTKAVKNVLSSFGLGNSQEVGIEYKERPPLVVPADRDLPPPVTVKSPAANNPQWPSDADDKRRAEARRVKRERKSVQNTSDGTNTSDLDKSSEPPPKPGWATSMWNGMVGLGKTFSGEKEVESRTFVREPSRNALTDPPTGYRTPSPIEPYGINGKPSKKSDVDKQAETVK